MTLTTIITVKEVFNHIKKLKNIFIYILILSTVSTIYLIINNNNEWKASIELRQLDSYQVSGYKTMEAVNYSVIKSINNLEKNILALQEEDATGFYSQMTRKENNESNQVDRLFLNNYDEKLLINLIDQTLRKEIIVDVLDKISILNKSDFNSIDQYYSQLDYIAVKFNTIPPIITPEGKQIFKRDYFPNWRISFVADEKELAKKTIIKVLEVSNKNVQQFLKSEFSEYLNVIKLTYDEKISTLKTRKSLLINQYDMSRENTIAFLNEQAALARSLGYDKNFKESQNITINIPLSFSSLRDSEGDDYYLRGYEFIETQIDLLNQRDDDFKKYIPELIQIDSLLVAIEEHQMSTLSKLENTFRSTPVYKESFLSAMYDSANINIDRIGISNIEIFIFSLLITFVFCILLIVISLILGVLNKEINN
mgnify:CR=1 FL=1